MKHDLNNILRIVWWIGHRLILSLAPQGLALELVQLLWVP